MLTWHILGDGGERETMRNFKEVELTGLGTRGKGRQFEVPMGHLDNIPAEKGSYGRTEVILVYTMGGLSMS